MIKIATDERILTTKEAANLLAVSVDTMRGKYRPQLIEGVHYFKPTPKQLRFWYAPLMNWFENRQNPDTHHKWLERHWGDR